jgi:hypothetical protein
MSASTSAVMTAPMPQARAVREPTPPARREAAPPWQDWLFERVTQFFALSVLAILAAIILALLVNAWPAWQKFGLSFVTTNVGTRHQHVRRLRIYVTIVTSLIALATAPVSFGIIFLTEMCLVSRVGPWGPRSNCCRDPVDHLRQGGLSVFAPFSATTSSRS